MRVRRQLLRDKVESIFDRADFEIFRTGTPKFGSIVLYNKPAATIDYQVQYRVRLHSRMAITVTHLKIWRNQASPYVQGITRWIFFDYFLQKYPAIMSDGQQSDNGQRFWLSRMAEATTLNYRVALVAGSNWQTTWFEPAEATFLSWISKHHGNAVANSSQVYHYLITN